VVERQLPLKDLEVKVNSNFCLISFLFRPLFFSFFDGWFHCILNCESLVINSKVEEEIAKDGLENKSWQIRVLCLEAQFSLPLW